MRSTGTDADGKPNRYSVRVLDRAFSLLKVLSDGKPRNLVSISAAADLDNSTTLRLLSALQSHGYIARHPRTGEYTLGIGCVELAQAYLGGSIVSVALRHLVALRDASRETVHLAVLDQLDVVYVDKQEGLHAVGIMSSRVGGRAPAYCTGVGKALLAYQDPETVRAAYELNPPRRFTDHTLVTVDALMAELDLIRSRGYAFDAGEHEADVRCVAAPVFDATGTAVAAISVSGTEGRLDPLAEQTELIEQTVSTAQGVSVLLGATLVNRTVPLAR